MPRRSKPSPRKRKSSDRILRERVFGQIAAPDISARETIADMDLYIHWLKTGKVMPKGGGLHLVAVREPIDRGQ